MKKSHIVGILIIAFAIAILISSMGSNSTYANFDESIKNEGSSYTVIGNLVKDKEMVYNPKMNANVFSFYMKDKEGKVMKVVLNEPRPTDFEKSEDIVVKGSVRGNTFYATNILLKCPSKYTDQQKAEL